MDSPYYDYHMASDYLHLSEQTVRRYVQDHRITFVKVGTRTLFIKTDLDDFMQERRILAENIPRERIKK
jgi:excisionase family DNA binding protein